MSEIPPQALQLRSQLDGDGTLRLSLVETEVPVPDDDEVLVRIEAAPINPSDLGLLLAGADLGAAVYEGEGVAATVIAAVPPAALPAMTARLGQSLPVGNEGGGVVVAAGSSAPAQALLGRTVGVLGGATYGQYRCLKLPQVLALPDGVTPEQGAACFVNPLTVLGHLGTMRREGHTALVHTAAASNLGQMMVRACLADGIGLVNVVRSGAQVELLRGLGASHVVDSSTSTFADDLAAAIDATGATIAFDAIGGGEMADAILTAMERVLSAQAGEYSRYGSATHKQVYVYGGLDRGPTVLNRSYGMAWSVGGWLLMPYLQSIGPDEVAAMRRRVADEITTTFASHYTDR
ncbi:MAG: NADH oxidase, partial [Desertimonas sp.]